MTLLPEVPGVLGADDVAATVAAIAAEQATDGMLPWWRGGALDAWDSVEAAMALTAGGRVDEAAAALDWLAAQQLPPGGFPSEWRDGAVTAPGVEANHAGYLAVGALHHALVTGSSGTRWWGAVTRALDLVCRMQLPSGAVGWALRPDGTPDSTALLTGNSSLLQALRCGLALADRVGEARPHWATAAARLQAALTGDPDAFDDRSRFSMDWYYPVLGGALTGAAAEDRLAASWDAFVVPGLGVRCVADRPWVTGAETCELAMALAAAGQVDAATEQLAAMQHLRHLRLLDRLRLRRRRGVAGRAHHLDGGRGGAGRRRAVGGDAGRGVVHRPGVPGRRAAVRRALDWLLADRTRADRRWTVAQWPNAAAWAFLALTLVRQVVDQGPWGTAVFVGTRVALVWWAGDELLRGVNPFRRLLGAAVLIWTAVGLLAG